MENRMTSGIVDNSQEDVLASYHQSPIIGAGDRRSAYVGRVIIELWHSDSLRERGTPLAERDASGLALSIEPATESVEAQELLRRVASALPKRVGVTQ